MAQSFLLRWRLLHIIHDDGYWDGNPVGAVFRAVAARLCTPPCWLAAIRVSRSVLYMCIRSAVTRKREWTHTVACSPRHWRQPLICVVAAAAEERCRIDMRDGERMLMPLPRRREGKAVGHVFGGCKSAVTGVLRWWLPLREREERSSIFVRKKKKKGATV